MSTDKSPTQKWKGSLPLIEIPNDNTCREYSSGNYIGRVKRNNNNIKHSGDSASQQSSWQPTMNQDKETLTCNKVSTIQSQLINH
jgi:hypothetical protein